MAEQAPVAGRPSAHESPRSRLLGLESPSGGWPYYRGRASRIEPTCWALLALSGPGATALETAALGRARAFLKSLMRPDGLLVEPATPGPNYAWNGLALLALNGQGDLDAGGKIATGLLSVKGIQIADGAPGTIATNGMLQAWSWTEGTFSWVEPTAWCLLALKVRRVSAPIAAARIAEAEAVIVDRVCETGGWNYGNSQVLAQDLRAYVPTTALALLAMQDKRKHPAIQKSLAWLAAHALAERASLALALTTICLHLYGQNTDHVRRALVEQHTRTGALDNAHLLAMTTYALALPAHRADAMRVP
jgi:hypothetical protein